MAAKGKLVLTPLLLAFGLAVGLLLGVTSVERAGLPAAMAGADESHANPPFILPDDTNPSAQAAVPAQITSVTAATDTLIISDPPVASLITIGHADVRGYTTITGTGGAVAANSLVGIACLDTAIVDFARAGADGSFTATVYAPPGCAVLIKHVRIDTPLEEVELTFTSSKTGDTIINWMLATSGTILHVPLNHSAPGGGIPFGFAGPVQHEEGKGVWTLEGVIHETPAGGGLELSITATVIVTTPALSPGMDLTGVGALAYVKLCRLFDQEGRQVPYSQAFVSRFLSPTGLPVAGGVPNWSGITATATVTGWHQTGDNRLQATISTTLLVPPGTHPGYYRPRMVMQLLGIPIGPQNIRQMRPGFLYGSFFENNGGDLPIVRFGEPAPPRLLWTLLTDNLSQGTRGTLAREDRGFFGIAPFMVAQSDTFIIPRVDSRTNEPFEYRLEPYLPLVSVGDRSTPNAPLVPFHLPSGYLEVLVRNPDGQVAPLGPMPFLQSTSSTPAFADATPRDNDGGALQEVYQLTTLDDEFEYEFQQYGHHIITMTGAISDVWGNLYHRSSTYDVYVARPLRLESGQLPATPYEVGDPFAPGVQIYPPAPADIQIRLTLLHNSNPISNTEHIITGQANRFGYFQPGTGTIITFNVPGEYRVDITAEYTDTDGTLWMGSMMWGSVVESPSPRLIAHGRRGLDAPPDIIPPPHLAWFFHSTLGYFDTAHTWYPYFSGDVFWGSEVYKTCNRILPAITVEDTTGGEEIYQIIRGRWDRAHPLLLSWETLEGRLSIDEAPLHSTTSDGSDIVWSPELIDQIGYSYRASQRPDARVHETIVEGEPNIHYWGFNAPYGDQVGYEGDLPNDIKWEFGGAVFRVISPTNPINEYAIYSSLWVLVSDNDPYGPRVTPPFSGTHGNMSGGPILTLQGEDVHLFFMPRGVKPGDVLEVGDTFSFSGHVGPPLNSHVTATVTSPTGVVREIITGQANKVGWFYNPQSNFPLDQPGPWTVHVQVGQHGPIPSSGAPTGLNTGGVLGSVDGTYHFYVVEPGSPRLPVLSPQPGFLTWPADPVTLTTVPIQGLTPSDLTDVVVSYTIRIPGFILEQGGFVPSGGDFTITYDPVTLSQDFHNLDLTGPGSSQPGLSDPVLITFLLTGYDGPQQVHRAGTVYIDGEEVHTLAITLDNSVYLPLILRQH
jgi:hypothetical protein